MRVLVLGASGMLARDLIARAPSDAGVIAPPEAEADITDAGAVSRAIAGTRPDVIINCAAYTNVDGAETHREQAFAVNGEGPGIIGRAAAAAIRPLVVHFSTDYVFNGRATRPYREDDAAEPLGAYGASKLAGEEALAASGAPYLIVRTSWLFGLRGRSFPRTMWERAQTGKATRVVSDQVGRPTYTVDLAGATWELLRKWEAGRGKPGTVVHVANAGQATWYDVARRVFAAAGTPELLRSCTTAEYPTPAARPAFSVLDTSRYEALPAAPLPRWEDAMDRFLNELRAEATR